MRVIRTAGDLLGFDSDFLFKHSFKRGIYFVAVGKKLERCSIMIKHTDLCTTTILERI